LFNLEIFPPPHDPVRVGLFFSIVSPHHALKVLFKPEICFPASNPSSTYALNSQPGRRPPFSPVFFLFFLLVLFSPPWPPLSHRCEQSLGLSPLFQSRNNPRLIRLSSFPSDFGERGQEVMVPVQNNEVRRLEYQLLERDPSWSKAFNLCPGGTPLKHFDFGHIASSWEA